MTILSAKIPGNLECAGRDAILRPLRIQDIGDTYLAGINSPAVQRYLTTDRQLLRSDLEDYIRANNAANSVLLGLFIGGTHTGNVRLHDYDGDQVWLGIAIFDASRWGQGWGSAALKTATEFAIGELGCDRVFAGIDFQNEASLRLFKGCGYVTSRQNDKGIVVVFEAPASVRMRRRLEIGTANFGMIYGVFSGGIRLPQDEVNRIVRRCGTLGVGRFDTAIGYGSAEESLGSAIREAGAINVRVTTKIPPVRQRAGAGSMHDDIVASRARLGIERFDAVLLHRAADLMDADGPALFDSLTRLKTDGLTSKIGVSVYAEDDVLEIAGRFAIDVVQLPYSIADQRARRNGVLEALKRLNIEICVRSVLLQGVLVADPQSLPGFFSPAVSALQSLDRESKASGVSRLAACVAFALNEPLIDRVVIGVNSVAQLEEVVAASEIRSPLDQLAAAAEWQDQRLLNPANWPAH